jgi:GDP-L-fucose synthase
VLPRTVLHHLYVAENNANVEKVYLAVAKVGGTHANNIYPVEFIHDNLMIEVNIIHAVHMAGVQKLLFLGSSYIYPKMVERPTNEDALLTGTLKLN